MEGIRQFLGARVVGTARSSKHGACGIAQVLPEVCEEKFPGLLDALAASACERQVLQVKRLQVGHDLARTGLRTVKSLLGAAPQTLGKGFLRQSPPRAQCLQVQQGSETLISRQ